MAYNKLQDDGLVYLDYIIQDHLVREQTTTTTTANATPTTISAYCLADPHLINARDVPCQYS